MFLIAMYKTGFYVQNAPAWKTFWGDFYLCYNYVYYSVWCIYVHSRHSCSPGILAKDKPNNNIHYIHSRHPCSQGILAKDKILINYVLQLHINLWLSLIKSSIIKDIDILDLQRWMTNGKRFGNDCSKILFMQ